MQTHQDHPERPTQGPRKALSARFWRTTCWFHQKLITSYADSMQALPKRTEGHLRSCPACHELYSFERELTRRLVTDPTPEGHSFPPFLHARIMASVDRAPQTTCRRSESLARPMWATALLLIGLGLLSIPLIRTLPSSKPPTHAESTAGSTTLQVTANLPVSMGREILE